MCFRPMRYGQKNGTRRQQGGYVLVIMLVIIVTGSLYGLVDRLNVNAAETSRVTTTNNALKQAREALFAHATTFPDLNSAYTKYAYGYLPCPDMHYDDTTLNMDGSAAGSCTRDPSKWTIGLLPYRSLGIPEPRDGDGNCLWYAVSGTHIADPGPLGPSAPTPNSGSLQVIDANGGVIASGVAAVIISPGTVLGEQSRTLNKKSCGTDSAEIAAFLESYGASFTHGITSTANGTLIKNDRLQWLTAAEISIPASKLTADKKKTSGGDDGDDEEDD